VHRDPFVKGRFLPFNPFCFQRRCKHPLVGWWGIGLVARATGNDLDMTAAIPGFGNWRWTLSSAVEQRLLITHGHFRVMGITFAD
jgi:hypothetical protein